MLYNIYCIVKRKKSLPLPVIAESHPPSSSDTETEVCTYVALYAPTGTAYNT